MKQHVICVLLMSIMIISCCDLTVQAATSPTYSTDSFYSTVSVTDDCFVNIAETFIIRNFGDNLITQFSRFIKRESTKDEIVSRSIKIAATNTVVNTSLVYTDEFIELQVFLKSPIGRFGGTDNIQLSYQMSGPLIVGNTIDTVKLNLSGPIDISPKTITFTFQVHHLHGYRQFEITPYLESITTLTENSVTWTYGKDNTKNPNLQVSFPSLKAFDMCRTIPMDSLLSISIVNLLAIVLLIIIQFIVIIGLGISQCRGNKKYGFAGNENVGYGSSH